MRSLDLRLPYLRASLADTRIVMAKEFSRTQRIGDQMQRELADLIRREIKDPRLGMTTVNEVKVSKDLSYADVYVTVLNTANIEDESAADESIEVLKNAAGFLRSELGHRIKLRVMPHLRFHYDRTLVHGRRISTLIDQARKRDEASNQVDRPVEE